MAADSVVKKVLVDSDALVALIKTNDAHFQRATRLALQAKKKDIQFFLSQYTLAEVSTVLSYKVSQLVAIQFLSRIHEFNLTVIAPTEFQFLKAEEIFVKQKKKGTSFFDCLNMALIEQGACDLIFSFDKIYTKNGIPVYGAVDTST